MSKYEFKDGAGEHLHTLDGKPLTGTSSVMSIVAKPLTWWASGEAVKTLGWTHPKYASEEERKVKAEAAFEVIKGLTVPEYIARLDKAYGAHNSNKNKAATKGKNLHKTLETYVKLCIEENGGVPLAAKEDSIQDFIDWSVTEVDQFLWSELHVWSEKYWIGGITDAGARLKSGRVAIIDFKSSKAAYPNQFWQCGGYDVELSENGGWTATGEKIMEPIKIDTHIIIPFGAETFSPAVVHTPELNRNAFLAALLLYRANGVME